MALVIASLSISWFLYLLSDTIDRRVRFREALALEDEVALEYYLRVLGSPEVRRRLQEGEEVRFSEGEKTYVFRFKVFDLLAHRDEWQIILPEEFPPADEFLAELGEEEARIPYLQAEVYREEKLLYHTVFPMALKREGVVPSY